jgi:hypothetical protein
MLYKWADWFIPGVKYNTSVMVNTAQCYQRKSRMLKKCTHFGVACDIEFSHINCTPGNLSFLKYAMDEMFFF